MPKQFTNIRYHAVDSTRTRGIETETVGLGAVATELRGVGANAGARFSSDEAAARSYLGMIIEGDDRPTLRGLPAVTRPEVVPDVRMIGEIRGVQHTPM